MNCPEHDVPMRYSGPTTYGSEMYMCDPCKVHYVVSDGVIQTEEKPKLESYRDYMLRRMKPISLRRK